MMLMLLRRKEFERGFYKDAYFQLGVDSSPQIQEDYLVAREEVLTFSQRQGWQHNPLGCLQVESRTKVLTTLAWGETSATKKHVRLCHTCILDTSEKHIGDYRQRMCQGYSDQGTEKTLWRFPNILGLAETRNIIHEINNGGRTLHDATSQEGFMWPIPN